MRLQPGGGHLRDLPVGIRARGEDADHVGVQGLGLLQDRGDIGGIDRHDEGLQQRPALRHDMRREGRHGALPEAGVGDDGDPSLAIRKPRDIRRRRRRQGNRVERIMIGVFAAGGARQSRRGGERDDREAMALGRDFRHGDRDRRVLHVHEKIGAGVERRLGHGRDVGRLVAIVLGVHDDRAPEDSAAEIRDGHARRIEAARARARIVDVVVEIRDHRDADGILVLRVGARDRGQIEAEGERDERCGSDAGA